MLFNLVDRVIRAYQIITDIVKLCGHRKLALRLSSELGLGAQRSGGDMASGLLGDSAIEFS